MLPHTATTTDGVTYLLQIHEDAGQRESPDTTARSGGLFVKNFGSWPKSHEFESH